MSAKLSAFRQQWPIYGAGLFSNSNVTISSIIVPLWALYLGVSPGIIGVLLGIRHLPGLLFAIHGGVLAGFMETAAMIQLMVLLQTPTIPKIVNISFDYLRAGFHRDTFSECSITRQGRRVANVNVRAWQKKRDEPLATARAHFLLS